MRYVEFMKKVVPLHDDLFDFFYEALPGYEHVGERRILLGCWGSLNDPEHCDFRYQNMTDWGRKMFVTPGVIVDGKLVTNDLVDINLGMRILLGSSYYEDWDEPGDVRRPGTRSATRSTAGTRGTSTRSPSRRSATSTTTTPGSMSPRWFDGTDHLALDTGGGPIARLWSTALAGLVDIGYVKATGHSVLINLPRRHSSPRSRFEWKIPQWSNALEREPGPHLLPGLRRGAARCTSARRRSPRSGPAAPRPGSRSRCRTRRSAAASPRRCAACFSHHMVIRDGKIANYHPYPPTPWNGSVRDIYGTPGPYEDAVQNTPIFEENPPDNFKGIDIMRAVRSFDPCLPCGVHMFLGNGKAEQDPSHYPSIAVTLTDLEAGCGPARRQDVGAHGSRPAGRAASGAPIRRWPRRWRSWSALLVELYGAGLERIC